MYEFWKEKWQETEMNEKPENLQCVLVNQLESRIQNPAFWLVGKHQILGANLKLIGHVTNSVPCKDSKTAMLAALIAVFPS